MPGRAVLRLVGRMRAQLRGAPASWCGARRRVRLGSGRTWATIADMPPERWPQRHNREFRPLHVVAASNRVGISRKMQGLEKPAAGVDPGGGRSRRRQIELFFIRSRGPFSTCRRPSCGIGCCLAGSCGLPPAAPEPCRRMPAKKQARRSWRKRKQAGNDQSADDASPSLRHSTACRNVGKNVAIRADAGQEKLSNAGRVRPHAAPLRSVRSSEPALGRGT